MKDTGKGLLAIIASLMLMFFFGWVFAHSTVAHECKTLGGFYVGDKTFECRLKPRG
jgi:hypothetical protein